LSRRILHEGERSTSGSVSGKNLELSSAILLIMDELTSYILCLFPINPYSSDLYEDAKRDLSDLGLMDYAENNCFNLGKLPYGSLVGSGSGSSKGKKKKGKGKTTKNKGQFLEGIEKLGTGAMELVSTQGSVQWFSFLSPSYLSGFPHCIIQHAMHLKSIGAIVARTLSYEDCEFALVENESSDKNIFLYNSASELWTDLFVKLGQRCSELKTIQDMRKKINERKEKQLDLDDNMLFHQDLHEVSDDEYDSDDEDDAIKEQRALCRKYRGRKAMTLRGLFWSAHQSFFHSLCITSKVDKAIELSKEAINDGKCVVIGLQSTGEARAQGATKAAEGADESSRDGNSSGRQPLQRARSNVNYSERDVDEEGNLTGKRSRAASRGKKSKQEEEKLGINCRSYHR
jgi:hypothetical protein